KISFIPVLIDWIAEGGRIGGVVLEQGKWFNIGNRGEYLAVHRTIAEEQWRPTYLAEENWPLTIDPTAVVDPTARVDRASAVGANCRVGAGATLRNTIAWTS